MNNRLYDTGGFCPRGGKMRKPARIYNKDLDLARKYCFGSVFPASDERCPYAKAKLLGKYGDFEQPDGIFLCRYPDEEMPTHEARLISDLSGCPNAARRKEIETLNLD